MKEDDNIKSDRLVFIYLLITVCAWGSFHVVGKFVLNILPPFTMLTFRYLIALTALLIANLLRKHHHPAQKVERQDQKYILFIGIFGYFISVGAQMIGIKMSTPSISALLNALNPIFIIAFSIPILKEKITVNKVISVTAALAGSIVITAGNKDSGALAGIIVIFIAVLMWSLMSVLVRRITQKYDALMITTRGIFIGLLCTLPIAIMEQATSHVAIQMDLSVFIALLYIGLVCTALSLFLWNKSLSMIEAGYCALFYPVMPVVAMFLSWLFLDEKITTRFVIGTVLIAFGVFYTVTTIKQPAALDAIVHKME